MLTYISLVVKIWLFVKLMSQCFFLLEVFLFKLFFKLKRYPMVKGHFRYFCLLLNCSQSHCKSG